jgi:hypothetical protein
MATESADPYAMLLELNREAFEAGRYKAAYHALLSAMYCAEELGDAGRLAEVAAVAKEQGEWLDRNRIGLQPAAGQSGSLLAFAAIAPQALALAEAVQRRQRKGE